MKSSTEGLKAALEMWENIYGFKARFVKRNTDPEGGEPLCGYSDWDEYMSDLNYDLADAGEFLADAVAKFLK